MIDLPEEQIRHELDQAHGSRELLKAIRTMQGTGWPCGHFRTPATEHRIGDRVICRQCRRRRIRNAVRKEAFRRMAREQNRLARIRAREMRQHQVEVKRLDVLATSSALHRPGNGRLPLDDLLRGVAAHFHLTAGDLKGPSRKRDAVHARAVVTQILRSRNVSYPVCGRVLGGRDHSTTINSAQMFPVYLETDPRVIQAYEACRDRTP